MPAFLIPLAGGDPIPLVKPSIVIGRRPDCDVWIDAHNVSGRHCELRQHRGGWILIDLKSTNGTKVNGEKIQKKKLLTGDEVTFARKHLFRIEFETAGVATAPVSPETDGADEIEGKEDEHSFRRSLLDKAGLAHAPKAPINDVDDDGDVFDAILNEVAPAGPKAKLKPTKPRRKPAEDYDSFIDDESDAGARTVGESDLGDFAGLKSEPETIPVRRQDPPPKVLPQSKDVEDMDVMLADDAFGGPKKP